MNWTCLVYGAPMFLVTVWWIVSAHKWFKGPKVNIEHMMLGREEAVVVGHEANPKRGLSKDEDSDEGDAKMKA